MRPVTHNLSTAEPAAAEALEAAESAEWRKTREQRRSGRKREQRAITMLPPNRTTKRELDGLRAMANMADVVVVDMIRPRTRGDCEGGLRPCPFARCKYNLFLDVSEKTGAIKLNFPDLEVDELPEAQSCALDVADHGGETLEKVGEIMNLTRERIRQVESKALVRYAAEFKSRGILDEEDVLELLRAGKGRREIFEDDSEEEAESDE